MVYIGGLDYWEDKFKSRGEKPLAPDQALVEHVSLLKRTRVLDLACGDGRNSLFLASKGFQVTGIDFSLEGLNRLDKFSKAMAYDIITQRVDLSKSNALKAMGEFDSILVNHYKLSSDCLANIHQHLSHEGTLMVSGFSCDHPVDEKIKHEDLILEEDFNVLNEMSLIKHERYHDSRGHFVTFIFKRD